MIQQAPANPKEIALVPKWLQYFFMIDTHAHLDFPEFQNDLPEILTRAREAGVRRIISIGTTLASSRAAVALAEKHEEVFATVGIHPNNAAESSGEDIEALETLCSHPKVVAIGEIGLDYYRLPSRSERKGNVSGALLAQTPQELELATQDGAEINAQKEVFQAQLDLAARSGLNVVIHQRDSFADTLEIIEPYTNKLRGVFHCFGGDSDDAQRISDMGHLVSFTGIITFKNAPVVRETAASIPDGSFMIETDCPYLAPVPHRGKRCEPAYVSEVAKKLAEVRGVSVEQITEQTTATANAFFRF
ncbi:MAG: TatD family hydrolase [Chthoniobacterales bacterium]